MSESQTGAATYTIEPSIGPTGQPFCNRTFQTKQNFEIEAYFRDGCLDGVTRSYNVK